MAKTSPKLVGAFVLVGIALLVAGIVVFTSGKLFSKTHDFIVFFPGNVGGLRAGAPVKFRGVEIGAVNDVRIDIANVAVRDTTVGVPVIFYIDEKRLTERGASARLVSNPDSMEMLIQAGLRAQLKTESIVTGRRYIELDILPGTPDNRINDRQVPYLEIPSAVTGLDLAAIQDDITRVLGQIGDLELAGTLQSIQETFDTLRAVAGQPELRQALRDLPRVVNGLDSTLAGLHDLARHMDTSVVPIRQAVLAASKQADSTLRAAENSFRAISDLLAPESPLAVQLTLLLREVAASARATTQLTDYLERNPSAVLRGKPEEND